jgi:prevent-host-death family protein
MTSMAVSTFKAHALETFKRVAGSRESVVITRRGKPVARVVPYISPVAKAVPGKLAETLVFEHDIVSPLEKGLWEAAR